MSHDVNTEWLEAANENFEQAVTDQNWKLAQGIIADTKDKGFKEEAEKMEEQLADEQADNEENYE